jgi:hypothetical protein
VRFTLTSFFIGALFFTGCAKEVPYYIMHDIAKRECSKIVNLDERRACENSHDKNYQDFNKEKSMSREY